MTCRFSIASRHVIKVTEPKITAPPSTTQRSTGSAKTTTPRIVAQTNCRKVTGCVTVTGAAAKASVMVK